MCAFDKKLLLVALASSRIQKQKKIHEQTEPTNRTNKQTAKLDIHNIHKDVIHTLGKRGSARTWRRFCMSTIGHIGGFVWTCLRIDIVSGNQLAIVSIPGDRLFEIGSRMVREQERAEAGKKSPRIREELTENDNNYE